jgi:hypothetical protein
MFHSMGPPTALKTTADAIRRAVQLSHEVPTRLALLRRALTLVCEATRYRALA